MHLLTLFLEHHGKETIFRTIVTVGVYLNLLLSWLADNTLFPGSKKKAGKEVHLDASRAALLKLEALRQLNSL